MAPVPRRPAAVAGPRPLLLALGCLALAPPAAGSAAAAEVGSREDSCSGEPVNESMPEASSQALEERPAPGLSRQESLQCQRWHAVEERSGDALETLLVEDAYPFIVAFFSESSPLARSEGLAIAEQRLAASFPDIRYFRVDADHLSMRAFLHWDISFLPTYVLFLPSAERKRPGSWHRWGGDGAANPYSYETVAAFVERASGFVAANSSARRADAPLLGVTGPLPPRAGSGFVGSTLQLAASWTVVVVAALHRLLAASAPEAPSDAAVPQPAA